MKYFYLHFLFLVLIFRPQRREILCRGRSDSGWRFICFRQTLRSRVCSFVFRGKIYFSFSSYFLSAPLSTRNSTNVSFFCSPTRPYFPDSEMVLFALKESNYGLCLPLNGGNFLYSSYLTYVQDFICVRGRDELRDLVKTIRATQKENINLKSISSCVPKVGSCCINLKETKMGN